MGARDLRAELLAAAVGMLNQPQAVAVPSLRSIARTCGVAPSAVYWHFPSQVALRSAVLAVEYADLVSVVEAAIADRPRGAEALVAAGQAYARWGLANPGAYQLLFESDDPLPETLAEAGPALQRRIVELAAIIDPTMPFASALLLWSAQHGLVSLRIHKSDWNWELSLDDAVARVVSALIGSSPYGEQAH